MKVYLPGHEGKPQPDDFPLKELGFGLAGGGYGVYRIDPLTGLITHKWLDPETFTEAELIYYKGEQDR